MTSNTTDSATAGVRGGTLVYSPPSGGYYRFQLCVADEGWRAYIVEQPAYGERESYSAATHRNYDAARSAYFVDFDPPPQTRELAASIAKVWAEKTTLYCRDGKSF